jgi:aspartate-semialdehyde dehydrogenase
MRKVRILLAGAADPEGTAIREALDASSFQVSEMALLDPDPAGLLTQFRGETKMSAPIPPAGPALDELLEGVDLAFLCGPADPVGPLQARCAREGPAAVSTAPPDTNAPGGPCVYLHQNAEAGAGKTLLYAPSPAACAAVRLLAPLDAEVEVEEVSAILLTPASDREPQGAQALCDQTTALLNMQPVPTETFPFQRAFNLLPPVLAPRLQDEVVEILSLESGSVAAATIAAPVFHGHGLALCARTRYPIDGHDATGLLRRAGLPVQEGVDAGPVAVAAASEMRAAPPAAHDRRLWMWAAFDPESSGSLQNALDLGRRLIEGDDS